MGVILGLAAVASPALAQPKPAEVARAATLLDRARQKLAANEIEAACALFAASYGDDPQVGTLFDLAICHERAGRVASAFGELNAVAEIALRMGQAKRAEAARDRAQRLEPKLSRVVFDVRERDPGVVVKVDGRALVAADLRAGAAIPVDPGGHFVTANAPGKVPWKSTLAVVSGAPQAAFAVPALDDAPPEPVAAMAPAAPPFRVVTRVNQPLRTGAWIAGAGALGGLALGGVGAFASLADDPAPEWKTVTTAGFVTAGVLAVTSAVLFLLSADPSRRVEALGSAPRLTF